MKTTTHYLVALTVLFSTFTFGNTVIRDDQNEGFEFVKNHASLYVNADLKEEELKKPILSLDNEIQYMDSVATMALKSQKSIEYTIDENKKITESQEEIFQPLYLERTIEEVIKEDNQIIESNLVDETFPLDFELIKNYENPNKTAELKNTIFNTKKIKS